MAAWEAEHGRPPTLTEWQTYRREQAGLPDTQHVKPLYANPNYYKDLQAILDVENAAKEEYLSTYKAGSLKTFGALLTTPLFPAGRGLYPEKGLITTRPAVTTKEWVQTGVSGAAMPLIFAGGAMPLSAILGLSAAGAGGSSYLAVKAPTIGEKLMYAGQAALFAVPAAFAVKGLVTPKTTMLKAGTIEPVSPEELAASKEWAQLQLERAPEVAGEQYPMKSILATTYKGKPYVYFEQRPLESWSMGRGIETYRAVPYEPISGGGSRVGTLVKERIWTPVQWEREMVESGATRNLPYPQRAPLYIPARTPGFVPLVSPYIAPLATPLITSPTPITVSPTKIPEVKPTTKQFPYVAMPTIVAPIPGLYTPVWTNPAISPVLSTELQPAPAPSPVPPYVPPPVTYVPPPETPPPTKKVPPWWLPKLPGLPGMAGGYPAYGKGYPTYIKKVMEIPPMYVALPTVKYPTVPTGAAVEKHGTRSYYIARAKEVAETAVTWDEALAMKPAGIDTRLWRKLLHDAQGVEMTSAEGELVMTPFGIREVHPVTKRVYLKGGAKPTPVGTFSTETFKPKVSKKMAKAQARKLFGYGGYENQPEIQALSESVGM
jgi:hypothetical protein